jgi:hypothetical protein
MNEKLYIDKLEGYFKIYKKNSSYDCTSTEAFAVLGLDEKKSYNDDEIRNASRSCNEIIKREFATNHDLRDFALTSISEASKSLKNDQKRELYVGSLYQKRKTELWNRIEVLLNEKRQITASERRNIEKIGLSLNLTAEEIQHILEYENITIEEKKHTVEYVAPKGKPKLETYFFDEKIVGNVYTIPLVGAKLNDKLVFEFEVKNGGGGEFFANVLNSSPWVSVSKKQITHGDLPYKLVVILDFTKNKNIETGSAFQESLIIQTPDSRLNIIFDIKIEGSVEVAFANSKKTEIISASLATLLSLCFGFFKYESPLTLPLLLLATILAIVQIVNYYRTNWYNSKVVNLAAIIFTICYTLNVLFWLTLHLVRLISKFYFRKNPTKRLAVNLIPGILFSVLFILVVFNHKYGANLMDKLSGFSTGNAMISTTGTYARVNAKSGLNLRENANNSSSIIIKLKNQQEVYIQSEIGEWYSVKTYVDNYEYNGFVMKKYIK